VTNATITANAAAGPLRNDNAGGAATADKMMETAVSNIHRLRQTIFGTSNGQNISAGVWFKAGERTWAVVEIIDRASAARFAYVNLQTGALGTLSGTGGTFSVDTSELATTGWVRLGLAAGSTGTGGADPFLDIFAASANGVVSYLGDITKGIYIGDVSVSITVNVKADCLTTNVAIADQAYIVGARLLYTDGWTPSQATILKAGDYLQLGSGSSARLHMVQTDVASDPWGCAAIYIVPGLYAAPADAAAITVSNPKGRFRLADNDPAWAVDEHDLHTLGFDFVGEVS
jgi:hypothetical protein